MKIHFENKDQHERKEESILFHTELSADQVKIKETPFGVQFDLGKDFTQSNKPGTPALPSKILQVALPADAVDIELRATSKKSFALFNKPVFVMPVPDYRIGNSDENGRHHPEKGRKDRLNNISKQTELRSIPSPTAKMVLHQADYSHFLKNPSPVAEYISDTIIGNNKIVSIRINPITLNEDSSPQLNQEIEVLIKYRRSGAIRYDRKTTTRTLSNNSAINQSVISNIKEKVINPQEIVEISKYYPHYRQYDYLIITDNNTWDSDTITANGAIGDTKTIFEKLAAWKRQKGLSAIVVTVTDIVGGLYGNFKAGAVDLQEVLRNFLKYAHSSWGISWCLLGGDVEIIPVRLAAGEIRGDVNEQTINNPPHDNEAFWNAPFMKIKAVSLGEWFSVYDDYLKLTNQQTGQLIPKKAPASSFGQVVHKTVNSYPYAVFETTAQFRNRLGWYFCTDETYMNWSSTPTNFVRVDGPAAVIHAQLRFHYTWNTIPTDLYYSSLVGPNYSVPGKHDWDFNNNGIYGQYEGSTEFDPINWHSDIIVGRAPVSSPYDAEIFVDKVIAYEKFHTENGNALDRNYLDKMLLVSSNWGGRLGYWPSPTNPPPAGSFHTQTAQSRAVLQTADDTSLDWNWELLSWIDDNNVSLIPYNIQAAPFHKGWYFATSPTDLSPAYTHIDFPPFGIHFDFPQITHTIVIYGTDSEIAPAYFVLDANEADGSMMDQEALREQVDAELPILQRFNRLYEDVDSLPVANTLAAPVSRLTDAALTAALNEGQHFLSLSGHGNQGGCCMVDDSKAIGSSNGTKYFITFADSCLTNAFDSSDSMSEYLINNGSGGAVAYIGHTRFSWIGLGDDFQRAFFHELVYTRHIGLMHNSRLALLTNPNDHYTKWTILALNLLGDPEMEVWKRKPFVLIPSLVFSREKIYLEAYSNEDLARKAIKKVRVKVHMGGQVFHLEPDQEGAIPFEKEWLNSDDVVLTITAPGSLPYEYTSKELNRLSGKAIASELSMFADLQQSELQQQETRINELLTPDRDKKVFQVAKEPVTH